MTEVLGKYRLIAELGRGGMGTVYLAVIRGPARFNKLVVIKQLRTDVADDASFTTMFLEEARLAARLNHPNIVQTNEVVCDPRDGYFIVMEYLEGASLKSLLRRLRSHPERPEPARSVRSLFIRAILEVLTALQYAHELKDFDGEPLRIVHRDVSPANVVVAHGGQVKLLDFGIAKAADSIVRTQTGILKGKIHYMSPEPLAGDPVDRRLDVFAVGAMLWDALAGKRLWDGMKDFEIVNQLLRAQVPSPRTMNPDVSDALEAICMRALACKAADRYPTAVALREDLERACTGEIATTDELSAAMNAEFSEDQQQMRARISEQLQLADDMPTSILPSLGARVSSTVPGMRSSESNVSRIQPPSPPVERIAVPPQRQPAPLVWRIAAAVGACAIIVALIAVRVSSKTPAAVTPEPAASSVGEVTPAPAIEAGESARASAPPEVTPAPTETTEPDHGAHANRMHHASAPALHATGLRPGKVAHSSGAASPETAPPAETSPMSSPDRPTSEANASLAPTTQAASPETPATAATTPSAPAPAVPNGTIPKAAQISVRDAHRPEIQACFDRARMDQPFLAVRLVIDATVAPDGHVSDVNVTANHDGTARLQACIRSDVLTWVYPRPAGDTAGHVSSTFVFE